MSCPLQNIYLITYIKIGGSFTASMKANHTKQIIKQAMNCLNNIPPQRIQKAVILVGKDDEQHMSLKSLIGKEFQQLKQAPFGVQLEAEGILIDPGEYIAYPEHELNFIIRRYLAKHVKKAKFIFSISLSQISQLSLMGIQQLFINFFHLFRDLDDLQMEKLAHSCGIMVLDIKNQQDRLLYKERLLRPNGLLQQGFVKGFKRNVQVLLNTITSKDLIFGGKVEGNILKQFQVFQQKLGFFDYDDSIKHVLPNKYVRACEQKLQISTIWHSLMRYFYDFIPPCPQNKEILSQKLSSLNITLYEDNISQNNRLNANKQYELNARQLSFLVPKDNHDVHSYSFLGKYKPKSIVYPKPIPAIIYSKLIIIRIDLQVDTIQVSDRMPGQTTLMEYFYFLYQIECISIDIYVFLSSYYHVYDYLSTNTNDDKNDLITKINILQIKNQKDFSIIRSCIKLLLSQLQNKQISLQDCKQIAVYLQRIIKYCYEFKEKLAITNKILSNLQDQLANIYYRQLKSQKNKKMYTLKAINYLKFSINCKEHHQSQTIDILKGLIQKLLVHQHSYNLGYQIASLLPQYEVQNILLSFYQDRIGLCREKFKFIEQQQKAAILNRYYSDYANYLLKIGYNQRLRELCMIGLQTTRNTKQQQLFRVFLIRAQKETDHQQFIINSILKHKQIVLTNDLINKIQKELLRLKII